MSRAGGNRMASQPGRASRPGPPTKNDEELRADIRRQVVESRRRQGLPSTIQDPVILAKLAALLLATPEPPERSS